MQTDTDAASEADPVGMAGVWRALGVDDEGQPADEWFWLTVDGEICGGSVSNDGGDQQLGVEEFRIQSGQLEESAGSGEQPVVWQLGFDQVYDDGARTRHAASFCMHHA